MKKLQRGSVSLPAGTAKEGFIFRSDACPETWFIEGPFFRGLNIHHFVLDPRDHQTPLAATYSDWWGCDVQRSHDSGRTWLRTRSGVRYAKSPGLSVKRVWHIRPGRESEPRMIYAGADPVGTRDANGARWRIFCRPSIPWKRTGRESLRPAGNYSSSAAADFRSWRDGLAVR